MKTKIWYAWFLVMGFLIGFLAAPAAVRADERDPILDDKYMIAQVGDNEVNVISNVPCEIAEIKDVLKFSALKVYVDRNEQVQGCWWHDGDIILLTFADNKQLKRIPADNFQPVVK